MTLNGWDTIIWYDLFTAPQKYLYMGIEMLDIREPRLGYFYGSDN